MTMALSCLVMAIRMWHRTLFLIVDKLDPDGNLEWSRSLEACNFYHYPCSIVQTPDSGYIVTCYIETYPSFEFIPVLIKLTPAGIVDKSFQYTSSSISDAYGNDIVLSGNGLVFCILIDNGILLMKTDFSGNVLWSKNNPRHPDFIQRVLRNL